MNTIDMLSILTLILISSISKAYLDLSSENLLIGWWNKSNWRNKYTISKYISDKIGFKKQIYWLFTKPLVMFTDGWHTLQFISFSSLILSVAVAFNTTLLNTMLIFLILKTIHTVVFTIIYDNKKHK